MAKKYDFRFVVQRAVFDSPPGLVIVPINGSHNLYHESNQELEFKEALAHLQALSDVEPRSHQASLAMKYRDDRKPPGYNKVQLQIQREGTDQ